MVEVLNHPAQLPTYILDVYEQVFENLHIQWMGIYVHPLTVILVQVGVKFWETEG